MDIDFGAAIIKRNGNCIKVTVNEFNEVIYLHIREYAMDGDTGFWFPTKTGISMPANEVSSLIPLLQDAEQFMAKKFLGTKQLQFDWLNENE